MSFRPFYARYQRECEHDKNSPYFLNDYNLAHSHPLKFEDVFLQKSKHMKRNYVNGQTENVPMRL